MSKKATLSASGLSLALGVINMSSLSSLTSSVEELKASMVPAKKSVTIPQSQNVNLFGSTAPEQTIVSSGNDEVDAMAVRAVAVRNGITSLSQRAVDVGLIKENTDSITKKLEGLEDSIQNVAFYVETLASIAPSTVDFATKWELFGTRAYLDDDSTTHLLDCKLGFIKNRGNKSAVHFAGLGDNNWSMYTSAPVGKSTDELSPQGHSGVNGNAVRMRLGTTPTVGLVVEAPGGSGTKNLLSVDSKGKTTIMSAALGNPSSNTKEMAGFSHKSRHSTRDCAVNQEKDGPTKINSAIGTRLRLSNNGMTKLTIEPDDSYTLVVDNKPGVTDTVFNHQGNNSICCEANGSTRFRSGKDDTDRLLVKNTGVFVEGVLSIDNISVNEMIRQLTSRVSQAETSSGKTAGKVVDFKR